MSIRRGLRNWLLETDSDPSVRFRVLRELLDRPADDPVVVRAQKAIGRKGWAAQLLRGQHPEGQWVTPGSSAYELYRPKYVATNWRLLVLPALGLTRKTPRGAKTAGRFLRRSSRPSNEARSSISSAVSSARGPPPTVPGFGSTIRSTTITTSSSASTY